MIDEDELRRRAHADAEAYLAERLRRIEAMRVVTTPVAKAGQSAEQVFGAAVREARRARGWTQTELAMHYSAVADRPITPTKVNRLESATQATRFEEAVILARLLRIDMRPFGEAAP